MSEGSSQLPARGARPERRLTRLDSYDYANEGAYFVTICTADRSCLFGEVVDGTMRPNDCGRAAADAWSSLPEHYPHVIVHAFSLMPNHVHGVLLLGESVGGAPAGVQTSRQRHGLPEVVRAFKTFSARRVNLIRETPGLRVWQRSYYEHVIRSEESLCRIGKYIADNPMQWMLDRENPYVRRAGFKPVPTRDGPGLP